MNSALGKLAVKGISALSGHITGKQQSWTNAAFTAPSMIHVSVFMTWEGVRNDRDSDTKMFSALNSHCQHLPDWTCRNNFASTSPFKNSHVSVSENKLTSLFLDEVNENSEPANQVQEGQVEYALFNLDKSRFQDGLVVNSIFNLQNKLANI